MLETVLGNDFPVLAVSGDRSLMLKRLALITSGHDVGRIQFATPAQP
jgi:hypothetical protein